MHYVGIDWADEKHDIYITNDSGKKLSCFEISNDRKGMLKLLAKAQRHPKIHPRSSLLWRKVQALWLNLSSTTTTPSTR